MGREIAKLLSYEGYIVGLVARRLELLVSLEQKLLPNKVYIKQIDVTDQSARASLKVLINEMGGDIDIVIISISAYLDNKNDGRDEWMQKKRTLDVTGKGFIAIADIAFQHFMERNHGHLVGISSTSGLWGCASGPEYSGVKAMVSTYLEGKRNQSG